MDVRGLQKALRFAQRYEIETPEVKRGRTALAVAESLRQAVADMDRDAIENYMEQVDSSGVSPERAFL